MDNIILDFDAFLRSFSQNTDTAFAFLLGAGSSITSGVQSANDCIWEWKKSIFLSNNSNKAKYFQDYRSDIVKKRIQSWLDSQGGFPEINSPMEYSFYAEKAFPIEGDRVKYFSSLVTDKDPYVGYKILCLLNKANIVKSVWTTNFDGLTERAAHQMRMTPIAINLDNPDRIYRNDSNNELLCIALHGDYKYTKLKNTIKELDSQNQIFIDVLKRYFVDKNLVVSGYSGRDSSLMRSIQTAFTEKGAGRLYWCGYGNTIPSEVENLIRAIKASGREAFYIPTDGFDKTMIGIASTCFDGNIAMQTKISEILNSIPSDDSTVPFEVKSDIADKYIKSNLYPIMFPKEVFQFGIQYEENETAWETIKNLTKDKEIIAIPFKGKIFALSTLTVINEVFGSRIQNEIQREAISIYDIKKIGVFRELFLKAVIYGICKSRGLNSDLKSKIWLTTPMEISNQIYVYDAIECSLSFVDNNNYALLSIKPTIHIISQKKITKELKLALGKKYLEKLRNKAYDDKVIFWENIIFGGRSFIFDIPINSKSDFKIQIGRNRSFSSIKVLDPKFRRYPIKEFDKNRIICNGIQFLEPQLEFINAHTSNIFRDYHPMRGLINNKPYDYDSNGILYSAEVKLGVICPLCYSDNFHTFLTGLNNRISTNYNYDYMLDYIGFQNIYNIPIDIPNVGSDKWMDISMKHNNAIDLVKAICLKIDNMRDSYYNAVAVIFIPEVWESYKRFENEGELFDLHDYIKAYAAQKNITTQIIQESTLSDPLKASVYWWLSLAFYVKSMRTPWALSNLNQETAYAGIGYSIKYSKYGKPEVVLGCSHIYNAKGEGLKYKLSKIKDAQFDNNKRNPYLTYDEAFEFGVSIRELFMSSMNTLPKRVVIHKRTPFKEDEINGIKDALSKAGIEDIDLIEINMEPNIRYFAMNNDLESDGYPVSRGTCIIASSNSALLWTHGIVPSVQNETRKYYLGGRSIPAPLKIVKHYGKGDINTIATEILGFTKMNWNSFDLYTKLPATIDTSNTLARIGNLLSRYEGKTYDYRYFI
ncbi:MAG: SIR2 family protein [Bacteroides sp.]|nr:SIR2 family protein [Bacteroides sp.]MCI1683693.1 SIR2 family protein [Bacteroides sp.]